MPAPPQEIKEFPHRTSDGAHNEGAEFESTGYKDHCIVARERATTADRQKLQSVKKLRPNTTTWKRTHK